MSEIKDAVADTTTKKNRAVALATHYAEMAKNYGITVLQAEHLCDMSKAVYVAKLANKDKAEAKDLLGDPFFTEHEKQLDAGMTVCFELGGVVLRKTLSTSWKREFAVSDGAIEVEVK